ncbi:bifunctional aminoglycoside phosphotransferase/ATP-binding protein [Parvibaculum sp.]|uniref:bifunctional aminoglycoside phosphotransferase/ATP-binding protein n=1 Tax=Parvibaculum sp. TaxID=2024848 RepID=UPI000C9487E0|nr:bifunctional aminoglycoside phosphotransferase/ATP-binding protein [Parvibaculum sp.]MAB14793.1 hypothetical protein [Parvibaculum sp.]
MTSDTDTQQTIGFLSRPEAYGLDAGEIVEHIETHANHIFLAGDFAWKMKKPIRFSFLDFSTSQKRREACESELALNRRTAPELYLGLAAVTRDEGGFRLVPVEPGADAPHGAADWLVKMKRFDNDGLLARQEDEGRLKTSLVEDLAARVASFHAGAEVTRDFGGATAFASIVADNAHDMLEKAGSTFSRDEAEHTKAQCDQLIERHCRLMDNRRDAGWVRRCHGDLHLGNVVEIDGAPVIFDCIEFNENIACIDVLYDLAFLLMDLSFREGETALLANRALNAYFDHIAEADIDDMIGGLPLVPLFVAVRAVVRAKVTAMQVEQGGDAKLRERARAFFDFAMTSFETGKPGLVAIGGLSGTGKSTVAKVLAPRLGRPAGALHLRTDIIRKRLFNVGPLDRLPEEAYAPEVGARVYAEMFRLAGHALEAGVSVVIDAVFAQQEERDRAAELAGRMGVPFSGLWLEADPAVLEARVRARSEKADDASDADVAVLRRQLAYDIGTLDWHRLDAAGRPEEIAARGLDTLTK